MARLVCLVAETKMGLFVYLRGVYQRVVQGLCLLLTHETRISTLVSLDLYSGMHLDHFGLYLPTGQHEQSTKKLDGLPILEVQSPLGFLHIRFHE
jgi:hypothetical protein